MKTRTLILLIGVVLLPKLVVSQNYSAGREDDLIEGGQLVMPRTKNDSLQVYAPKITMLINRPVDITGKSYDYPVWYEIMDQVLEDRINMLIAYQGKIYEHFTSFSETMLECEYAPSVMVEITITEISVTKGRKQTPPIAYYGVTRDGRNLYGEVHRETKSIKAYIEGQISIINTDDCSLLRRERTEFAEVIKDTNYNVLEGSKLVIPQALKNRYPRNTLMSEDDIMIEALIEFVTKCANRIYMAYQEPIIRKREYLFTHYSTKN